MDVYLVRHGETNGNLAMRHQSERSDLTERGVTQANTAAKILKTYQPTHIISSPMIRSLETTQIIEKEIDLIPTISDLFREVGRPKLFIGHYLLSHVSIWFYLRWYFGLVGRQGEGDETYQDVRERVKKARVFLESYPSDSRIVVVSHSVFIIFFLAHMCSSKRLWPWQALWCFFKIATIKNGALRRLSVTKSTDGTHAWRAHK
jgi:broad specificity phosphatase PhoE